MRALLALLVLSAALPVRAQRPAPRPVTLEEAYRLALVRSEELAASAEGVKQLEYAERQIRAAFRPSLYGFASETGGGGIAGRTQAGVALDYSLFSGMRDYLAARSTRLRTEAAALALSRAREALYRDTARSHINLAELKAEIRIRREQLKVFGGRLKELEARAAIGRSRRSEVVEARARIAQYEAALQAALSDEEAAAFTFAFITGLEGRFPLSEAEAAPPGPLEGHLSRAAARTDVSAARKALEAATTEAKAGDRLIWPSLDLSADYFVKSPSPNENKDWEAALSLKVPFYTGGYASAAAEEYRSRAESARLSLRLTERRAADEVLRAHSALTRALAVAASLETALGLALENSELQAADYKNGLVTNIDVLNAQDAVLQTALSLEQARARAAYASVELEVAAGTEK
ncbi:MAG: TolC family protein [Elusimicrobiales bacterium]|nr:TolC family protein [Elusimicrobiales bacterium]